MIFSDLICQTACLEAIHCLVVNTRHPKLVSPIRDLSLSFGKHVKAGHIQILTCFQIEQNDLRPWI